MPMRNQKGMPHVHSDSFRRLKESWGIAGIAFWSRGVMVRLCRAMRALLWHQTQERLWCFRNEYAFDIPSVYHLFLHQGWAWYHMLTQESAAHVGFAFSFRLAFFFRYMEAHGSLERCIAHRTFMTFKWLEFSESCKVFGSPAPCHDEASCKALRSGEIPYPSGCEVLRRDSETPDFDRQVRLDTLTSKLDDLRDEMRGWISCKPMS